MADTALTVPQLTALRRIDAVKHGDWTSYPEPRADVLGNLARMGLVELRSEVDRGVTGRARPRRFISGMYLTDAGRAVLAAAPVANR